MRYQPTDMKDRSHIGKNWNRYYLRSMQIILQATHGIVSGSPEFFKIAFGDTEEEYETLLLNPHHFLFNRAWYYEFDGKLEMEEWRAQFKQLSADERAELAALLSGSGPSQFAGLIGQASSAKVNTILAFYVPLRNEDERNIWTAMKTRKSKNNEVLNIPEDERVEDAGLSETI
jgi:hypothetical protein